MCELVYPYTDGFLRCIKQCNFGINKGKESAIGSSVKTAVVLDGRKEIE